MTALTATILSDETIASTKASLAALDALQQSVMSAAQANDAINSDDGIGTFFGFVRGVRSKFSDPDASDAKQQMPAPVVETLSTEVVPALADVVTEFEQLWTVLQNAVKDGGEGEPLVNEFLAKAEEDDSALMRVQNGLEKLQSLALSGAFEHLAAALS